MLVNKSMLSSLLIALPLLASVARAGTSADSSAMSLDQLRSKCEEYSQNTQLREFKMKIECSGFYEFFKEEKQTFTLKNHYSMSMQTTTKGGIFQTEPTSRNGELPSQQGTCSIWTKYRMSAPEGMGIPVTIRSCDQLTNDFVYEHCKRELVDYCDDNKVAATDKKSAVSGMCTLTAEKTINTCVVN